MIKGVMFTFTIAIFVLIVFGCGQDKQAKDAPGEADNVITITGKDGAEMALIPAGEFEMGDHHGVGSEHSGMVHERAKSMKQKGGAQDTNEGPVHTVYLDAFYIDKYEVTNTQYAEFLNEYERHTGRLNTDGEGHKLLDGDIEGPPRKRRGYIYRSIDLYSVKPKYANHPAMPVSWYGAMAYAQFYDKRLPTEAQWEKAARGGLVGKKYPWGNRLSRDYANYRGTGGKDIWDGWGGTAPVGSFAPNGYGLYDMAGNVCEWCADWYDIGYYALSPKRNPTGPNSGTQRVLRGGTYTYDPAAYLRVAFRHSSRPESGGWLFYGFRCVQDVALGQ
jgi:formylglycine-generating enzyme required for sulfatase activity